MGFFTHLWYLRFMVIFIYNNHNFMWILSWFQFINSISTGVGLSRRVLLVEGLRSGSSINVCTVRLFMGVSSCQKVFLGSRSSPELRVQERSCLSQGVSRRSSMDPLADFFLWTREMTTGGNLWSRYRVDRMGLRLKVDLGRSFQFKGR